MKQEDKDLLLKDLCARLPYGVKIHTSFMGHENIEELVAINKDAMLGDYASIVVNPVEEDINDGYELENIKPYLRPMSSMTDEEYEQYREFSYYGAAGYRNNNYKVMVATPSFEKMDFLNAHHFDYRGLIEKGLALEAPADMYK